MQHGSLALVSRKEGPAVWQFRWSEKNLHGARVQRKRVIGTVERYLDEAGARSAIAVLLAEINSDKVRMGSGSITVAQLCDHFEQRELAKDNTWRSYSTKKTYQAYLTRRVLLHWRHYELAEVRTIQVESWLRSLPLAKSSCAKIRNLMSVLFNHACRYELFDRNPIYLVRQSAKRRRAPTVLMPAEIKALVNSLGIRERTLVLLAVSTGLRQSKLFGLKWGDIDLVQYTMNVTRSIVYGVVGPCKTESSQKPVPVHPRLADALSDWRKQCVYTKPDDWVFASRRYRGRRPYWGQAILRKYVRPVAAFDSAIHLGCVYPGDHACQTCSSGRGLVVGVFVRSERNTTTICVGWRCSVRTTEAENRTVEKGHKKGHKNVPLLGPRWFRQN
jgi:integrase